MSNEHDVPAGTTEPSAAKPRLTPPPRLVVPPPSDPRRAPATSSTPERSPVVRALATWLTIAFLGVLVLAAVAVFVVLPDWVEERQESAPEPTEELTHATVAARAPRPAIDRPAAEPQASPTPRLEEPIEQPATPAETSGAAPEATPPPDEPAETRVGETAATKSQPPPPRPATGAAWNRQRDDNRRDFERAMSEGLAALDREDYAAAREAFARAGELRPGSPQSADGLARAEVGARLSTVNRLREEALAAETAENWEVARQRYAAVLELDATVEFALDGQARAGRRVELSERMDYHVANPKRLTADEVLQEAQAILEQAHQIEPASDRLRQQREQLAEVVTAFATPVTATLESDRQTEVTIYKVGRLGTFDRHALNLRPGTYTVVGSRLGFRDVRRKLVIEPGVAPEPLTIRCEEKI